MEQDNKQGLQALLDKRLYNNKPCSATVLALMQQAGAIPCPQAYADSKPHLRIMLDKRHFNLIWPCPPAKPRYAPWLDGEPTKSYLRISLADLILGHIEVDGQAYRLAVDSTSLHLLSSVKRLHRDASFAAVAALQTWEGCREGMYIAAVSLTDNSKLTLLRMMNKQAEGKLATRKESQ